MTCFSTPGGIGSIVLQGYDAQIYNMKDVNTKSLDRNRDQVIFFFFFFFP